MKYVSFAIKALITLPLIAYLLFLTLENRSVRVDFVWSPFADAVNIALPLLALGVLVGGFIWGCMILWSNTLALRAERRHFKREKAALESRLSLQAAEMERLRTAQKKDTPAPQTYLPDIL